MSIPLSHVVDVQISLSANPLALRGFGELLMITDEVSANIDIADRITRYGTLASVALDYPAGTEVYACASTFFAQGASKFAVGVASAAPAATRILGGSHGTLAQLQAVTNGSLRIPDSASERIVSNIDFSADTTFTEMAATLATAMTGNAPLSASYNTTLGRFEVSGYESGSTAVTGFAEQGTQNVDVLLGLTSTGGGSIIPGMDTETPLQALTAIQTIDNDWYGIILNKKWRDNTMAPTITTDVATFAEASTKIFFNTTNNAGCLTTGTTDIISELRDMTLNRTISNYSSSFDQYPSASVAGRGFIVNFEGTNTTITLNLKQGPGITVEKLNLTQKVNLENKFGNAFVSVAGLNVYSESRMASGKWFDTIHGTDWLQNRIQTDVFNVLYTNTTKIPFTDAGVTILRQAAEGGLRQGVTNGLIAPGNDALGEFLPLGYAIDLIAVADSSPSDIGNRRYRGMSFRAVGAGAIHYAQITGSFNG